MRRFEVGDYVIIYNPKKDNVSFELNRLALKHEGMLGRIFKIKDILDMQVCSMKLENLLSLLVKMEKSKSKMLINCV